MGNAPSDLHQRAINAALTGNWEEAVKLNEQILELEPKNVDALNRLARSHFELGNLPTSKKIFEQSLKCDPYNQIAFKFLKRIEAFQKKGSKFLIHHALQSTPINSDLFIEEPGKTKNVILLKVAEPQKLSVLCSGELVQLVAKNRGISVSDKNGEYLGVLPDDISHQMIRLIKGGNKYQAIIKTIKTNSLSILIKEVFRSSRFKNQPSFLDNVSGTITYSSDHIVVPEDTDKDSNEYGDEEGSERGSY